MKDLHCKVPYLTFMGHYTIRADNHSKELIKFNTPPEYFVAIKEVPKT